MPKVEISGGSQEAVAYALLQQIIAGDERTTVTSPWKPNKKDLLETYFECLKVTKGHQPN